MARKSRYWLHVQKTAKHFSPWMGIAHGGRTRSHKSGCCDCGLVHDEQYRVVWMERGKLKKAPLRIVTIQKRVRVNKRATAAKRRAKKFASPERK